MARAPVFREVVKADSVERIRMTAAELAEHEKNKGAIAPDERMAKLDALETRIAALEKARP